MATKYNNHHKPPTPNHRHDPCPDPYHVHNIHGFRGESCADKCSDQLPLFSPVGRGIKGDSFKIEIESDSHNATYLAGYSKDEATKEWSKVWTSPNINGGCLNYEYTPYPEEGYFTITFIYTRPDREECEWSWTTPKIPYLGNDVFITYERLAKILSIPISQLKWLTENKESQEGTEDDTGIHNTENDLLDWIDNNDEALGDAINDEQTARQSADETLQKNIDAINQCECDEEKLKQEILNHLHNDLGFDTDSFLSDGKGKTVKEYIDDLIGDGLITKADVDEWIQEWLQENPTEFVEIFEEINENHQVTYYNDSPDDNELKAWWVLSRSDLLNLSMFKISCDEEDPTFKVDGKDTTLISGIPYDVIPAYGSIWPISQGEYWDSKADTMRPCTLFIGILGKNNVAEGSKGSLYYRCESSDGDYNGSDYVSGPMRVHNTVLYFNDYTKAEGEGSLPLNTANPLVAR